MQSYLDHHADKLAHRFDAGTYVALTEAMSTHDLGEAGGSPRPWVGSALRWWLPGSTPTGSTRCGSKSKLAEQIPTAVGGCRVIASPYGHDGFLLERDAVADLVAEVLVLAEDEISAARDLDRESRAEAC